MKTLHLNLKRRWFDMILSGVKYEEYREITPYWASRLVVKKNNSMTIDFWEGFLGITKDNRRIYEIRDMDYFYKAFSLKNFDTITFSNAYAKDRDQFVIEFKGIAVRYGNHDWGAKPKVRYFVLELGNILT